MSATSTAVARNKAQFDRIPPSCEFNVFEEISGIFKFPGNSLDLLHFPVGRKNLFRNLVGRTAESISKLQ